MMMVKEKQIQDSKEMYISEIKICLRFNYSMSNEIVHQLITKFKDIFNTDPSYIYHYDAEYWANYIAEANGFEKHNCA